MKVDRLAKLLVGFPLADYVVDGFTNGFHINFKGDHQPLTSHNAASATLNPEAVAKKIRSELDASRISGSFTEVPFKFFKSRPLSLREKSTPGQFRLLHNLSYPYDDKLVHPQTLYSCKICNPPGRCQSDKEVRSLAIF